MRKSRHFIIMILILLVSGIFLSGCLDYSCEDYCKSKYEDCKSSLIGAAAERYAEIYDYSEDSTCNASYRACCAQC